jgi:hypothetical protein
MFSLIAAVVSNRVIGQDNQFMSHNAWKLLPMVRINGYDIATPVAV